MIVKHMMDLKERDLEQLSAYLDRELNPKDVARLELRLKEDPQLQKTLYELGETRKLIRSLPQIRLPRNFTLTSEMAKIRPKRGLYPVFRLATVVATVAFALLVGADAFFRFDAGVLRATNVETQTVELAVEMEVEEAVEVPEATMAPPSEEMMLGAAEQDIVAEAPRAAAGDGTLTFEAEGAEPYTVEGTGISSSLPSTTMVPPLEPLLEETQSSSEKQVSTEAQTVTPSPEPTSIPVVEPEPISPRILEEPIRASEVGFGILAVILGVITIILRRQH